MTPNTQRFPFRPQFRGTLSRLFALAFCGINLVACQQLSQVQAWEKGALAKDEMRLNRDKLALKNADHIYTSKEAASGSGSVGGGGCGCN